MSVHNYVESPNSNLICCICRTPFTDPVTTTTCIHTFCRDCILRAIEHAPQCPVDRSPLNPGNLVPANPIVRSLVDELVVECVHRAEGCMHTCQRQSLPAHLLDSCLYREAACSQGKCTETMPFEDSLEHLHDEGKDNPIDLAEAQDDGNDPTASAAETPDDNKFQSPLPTVPMTLPSSNGTSASQPRLSALAEQNILLRHRVDTLENLLHTFRREMGAVKRALGPWYQLEAASSAFREVGFGYPSLDISPTRQPTLASTPGIGSTIGVESDITNEQQHNYPSRPLGPAPTAASVSRTDSIAAYFPAELSENEGIAIAPPSSNPHLGQHPLGNSATRLQHRMSLSADLMNYDAQNTHSFPLRHQSLVAPLNLGTTLEGTLHGLRESVIGLAASVDSMGRRNEIALSSETTRLAEEVGGLRAGVHGLRMQVHAIMMDRNAQLTGRDGLGDGMHMNWMPLPIPQPPPTRPFYPQPSQSITKL